MKKSILYFLLLTSFARGQGYNHQWLLGNNPFIAFPNGRMLIDSNNYSLITEFRKMSFEGTEANISDANGNLLMSSNGIWIANSTGDTMLNGSGLNPWGITPNWPYGLPMNTTNVFIPYPDDSNKYILFHHTATFNGTYNPCYEFLYSIINKSSDSVVSKNNIILQDTLNWGIAACKHANGRDYWAVMHKDSSDVIFKVLITNTGIANVSSQHLNYLPLPWGNAPQMTFSQDGTKFCSTTYDPSNLNSSVVLCDFDRCSGMFSNTQVIPLTTHNYLWGLAFSPSGKYLYSCSSHYIFQIDVNTLSVDTVAMYDGFISPPTSTCCQTTFWNMYLAANGKIYITSGSSVQHLHEMNYPDSAGIACDVQQHAIDLVSYLHIRAVPNHPNYYLGCDTTGGCTCLTNIEEIKNNFHFNIFPNPSNGNFNISYLLPQNKIGTLEIFDVTGKRIYIQLLPQWSTEQQINLSNISEGLYQCVLISNNSRTSKKIAIVHQ